MADHTGYDNRLAGGLNNEDGYTPFHLWAGETDTVTGSVTTTTSALAQFQVYAKNRNGDAVPYNPDAGQAGGTLTFGGQPTAADTLTIDPDGTGGDAAQVLTFVAAITGANQILIGTDATATATNATAIINSISAAAGVTATRSGTVVTLEAIAEAEEGNKVTLAKSGTYPALSGAALTGGGDFSAGRAVGFTAQAIPANSQGPVFIGGYPNHEALVWPASCATLKQRKLAFAGTDIHVGHLM